jgi:hypothetical protein
LKFQEFSLAILIGILTLVWAGESFETSGSLRSAETGKMVFGDQLDQEEQHEDARENLLESSSLVKNRKLKKIIKLSRSPLIDVLKRQALVP